MHDTYRTRQTESLLALKKLAEKKRIDMLTVVSVVENNGAQAVGG